VLRVQSLLTCAKQPSVCLDLAGLAAEAGYADQAEMTRKVRRLAGTTRAGLFSVSGLLARCALSDSFKICPTPLVTVA
jgi:hypothetical protein